MNRTCLFVPFLLCSALPLTLSGQVPADLVQAAQARDQAIDKVDVAAWERLTAPDFTAVNETGHLFTRADRIAKLKKTKPGTLPTSCGQERITMFANGSAALRRCLTGGNWWIDVWAKSASGWQVIAVQGTRAAR